MKIDSLLARELRRLIDAYREGRVDLHTLATRSESLVEHMDGQLSPREFQDAMNCVYLFEEFNGLALSENRLPTESEQALIHDELTRLQAIIERNSGRDESGLE